jgi:hypothetical protein
VFSTIPTPYDFWIYATCEHGQICGIGVLALGHLGEMRIWMDVGWYSARSDRDSRNLGVELYH